MKQKAFSQEVKVDIHGTPTPIRWNFTAALRFMDYVDNSTDDDETFLDTVLKIWYPQVPQDRDLALTRAIDLYHNAPENFRTLQKTCMSQDFSWNIPAQKYMALFRRMQ